VFLSAKVPLLLPLGTFFTMTSPDNPADQTPPLASVPKAVVGRLSLYLRELQRLSREGNETTSSTQIGRLLGFTDAQVRKDLAYFGQFGYPGIGYRCAELIDEIKRILGTDQDWPVALIGAGNLGRALLGYKGFARQGFNLVAAFDSDPSKIGTSIGDVPVFSLDDLASKAKELGIRLAVVTVPTESASQVTEKIIEAGIDGILNFAPVTLSNDLTAHIQSVDLAIELEQLSFAVLHQIAPPSP